MVRKHTNGRQRVFVLASGERLPLGVYIRIKRNGETFRKAAKESGVALAALHRAEKQNDIPGGANMLRLMKWMGLEVKDLIVEG